MRVPPRSASFFVGHGWAQCLGGVALSARHSTLLTFVLLVVAKLNAAKCNTANNNCGCNWDDGDCCGAGNDYSACVAGSDGTCCLDPDYVPARTTTTSRAVSPSGALSLRVSHAHPIQSHTHTHAHARTHAQLTQSIASLVCRSGMMVDCLAAVSSSVCLRRGSRELRKDRRHDRQWDQTPRT